MNYMRSYGSGDSFRVEIDPTTNIKDFHQASLGVAEELYLKHKKIYVMYSGGVDSEYILNVFLSLGIDVTPVIINLKPHYNEHDTKYAFDFCESKKLKPLVIDLDFDDFVQSGKIISIAENSQCGAYQLPSTFYAASQLDGAVVMGSHGPPYLTKHNGEWFVNEYEQLHSVLKHFKFDGLEGCPFFLVHTPEQYYSFLNHPLMLDVASNKYKGRLGSTFIKGEIYNDFSGFGMEKRPKFTGFENIEKSSISQHENIKWFLNIGKQWCGHYSQKYSDVANINTPHNRR